MITTSTFTRRQFIRAAAIGAGCAAIPSVLAHSHTAKSLNGMASSSIGLQLYTLRDPSNNESTADSLGVEHSRTYASWEDMLEKEAALPEQQRMQVVSIVTPNHLHVPISVASIKAGFHVFCEKPAGVGLGEVKDLQDLLHSTDRLYGLAHTYLGYPMVWQSRYINSPWLLGNLRGAHLECGND